MYAMNVTDYDNMTDDYNDILSIINNCNINENNLDIIIPTLLLTIPCGLPFLGLISLMVYTLIKPLLNIERWRNFYTQLIQFVVS